MSAPKDAAPKTQDMPPEEPGLRVPLLWAALPFLAMAAALLLRYPLWDTGWPQDGVKDYFVAAAVQSADGRLNINTADLPALCTLPGIGTVKARAILAYREAHGPFDTVDQLLEVSGIGEKTLEGLRELIYIGPPPEDPESPAQENE